MTKDEIAAKRAVIAREIGRLEAQQAAAVAQPDAAAAAAATPSGELAVEPSAERPWYRAGPLAGIAESGIKTALGVKDLFGDLTDEEKMVLRIAEAETEDATGGGVGKFAGDVAQMALPGAALKKTVGAVAKGALGAGAHSLLQPGDENRVGRALTDTAQAFVGGKVLNKALKGINKTAMAEKAKKLGVYLTPAMAGSGPVPRGIESLMSKIMPFASGTDKLRREASIGWLQKVMNIARPTGTKAITGTAREGGEQLHAAFKKAYTNAWKKVTGFDKAPLGKDISAMAQKYAGDDFATLKRLVEKIDDLNDPQQIDRALRKAASAARKGDKPNVSLADDMQGLRDTFRSTLGDDAQKALARVDKKYPAYLAVKKAGANAIKDAGEFTPNQLATAAKSVGGETSAFIGKAPLQDMVDIGTQTVGKPLINFLSTARQAVAKGAPSSHWALRPMGEIVKGDTAVQHALKKTLEKSALLEALPGAVSARGVEFGDY